MKKEDDKDVIAITLEEEGMTLMQLAALRRAEFMKLEDIITIIDASYEKLTWLRNKVRAVVDAKPPAKR